MANQLTMPGFDVRPEPDQINPDLASMSTWVRTGCERTSASDRGRVKTRLLNAYDVRCLERGSDEAAGRRA